MVTKLRKNLYVLGTALGLIRPTAHAQLFKTIVDLSGKPKPPKIEYRNLNTDLTTEG